MEWILGGYDPNHLRTLMIASRDGHAASGDVADSARYPVLREILWNVPVGQCLTDCSGDNAQACGTSRSVAVQGDEDIARQGLCCL
jgi:hypothetical protein